MAEIVRLALNPLRHNAEKFKDVPGKAVGALAVHKFPTNGEWKRTDGWTITHSGTGASLGRVGTQSEALRVARKLDGLFDWAFTSRVSKKKNVIKKRLIVGRGSSFGLHKFSVDGEVL